MTKLKVRERSRDYEVCEYTIVVDRRFDRNVRPMSGGVQIKKVYRFEIYLHA